ncbi:unnamed protein product [Dracunculus medinensis]|uniref:ELMO domain-containing protein n=1 Tax=Dracunculus medinensis TaxID=318479 RepID=A0A158Q2R7_DRAME|nr:unnamed protein product [Dracunculus medinensis]
MTDEIDLDWVKERDKVASEWATIERSTIEVLAENRRSTISSQSPSECEPPKSFQNIWGRLLSDDQTQEKIIAAELINKAENRKSTINRYRICRLSRRPICKLKNTNLQEERLSIIALTLTKYSETNPTHWDMLISIYKLIVLDGNRSNITRYGKHWESIGFQGDDPATDLRGVGIFGLCQLLFLVSNGVPIGGCWNKLDSNDHRTT